MVPTGVRNGLEVFYLTPYVDRLRRILKSIFGTLPKLGFTSESLTVNLNYSDGVPNIQLQLSLSNFSLTTLAWQV